MKTLTLFTIWALSWLAWRLTQLIAPNSRFEPLLSDASAMAQTDAEDMLSGVVKALAEA